MMFGFINSFRTCILLLLQTVTYTKIQQKMQYLFNRTTTLLLNLQCKTEGANVVQLQVTYEPVLISESKTYCETRVVRLLNPEHAYLTNQTDC